MQREVVGEAIGEHTKHWKTQMLVSRRRLMEWIAGATATGFSQMCARAATPECGAPTERMIEGPFFTPDSPERQVLREAGSIGTPLNIAGRVLGASCRPLAHALIDVWNADGNGAYDNSGYRLRGHQFTDEEGRFLIETVKPGFYGPRFARRTPHIHVKVQGEKTPLLTTQLYFPGEPLNKRDPLFRDSLLMDVKVAGGVLAARFDFVLAALR